MEPLHFLRLLRHRWVVLLLCAAVGAALGYASTLGDDDALPEQSYWLATEQIQAPSDQVPTLPRLATTITDGEPARLVAAQLGLDLEDFRESLRTMRDRDEGTIEIQVVALTAEAARDRARLLMDETEALLQRELIAEYEEALESARADVTRRESDLADLDRQTDEIQARIDAAEDALAEAEQATLETGVEPESMPPGPDENDEDQVRRLNVQRDTGFQQLLTATNELEDLEDAGPPTSEFVRLDSRATLQISRGEYANRISLGEQGFNNFETGQVALSEEAGGVAVDSRFDEPQARALAGGVAGLLIGLMLVLIHWRLDPRLRSREEAEAAFGLPVLTQVPQMSRRDQRKGVLHAVERPRSTISEAHRYLRSVLLYAGATGPAQPDATTGGIDSDGVGDPEREVRVVMVTSPGSGEGKTTTATNLAVVMAEAGYKTLLVNCDHRLPTAHTLIGCDYIPAKTQETRVENLTFVADVRRIEGDSPAEIANRQVKVLERARDRFDVVIVDTAPLMATNDAIDLLSSTDLVVVVAREAKTTASAAEETRILIDRIGTPIAGIVVTASGAGMGSRYYDRYRYGRYYGKQAQTTLTEPTPRRKQDKADKAAQEQAAKAHKKAEKAARKAAKNRLDRSQAPVDPQNLADFDPDADAGPTIAANGHTNGHTIESASEIDLRNPPWGHVDAPDPADLPD